MGRTGEACLGQYRTLVEAKALGQLLFLPAALYEVNKTQTGFIEAINSYPLTWFCLSFKYVKVCSFVIQFFWFKLLLFSD